MYLVVIIFVLIIANILWIFEYAKNILTINFKARNFAENGIIPGLRNSILKV